MGFEKTLPLGNSSFVALRVRNQIYIDKTDIIYKLANTNGKIFLSRPRRFGKSLLVSTFDTLFRDGLKWFDGLKIANLWKDKQYKVLSLDFSLAKDFIRLEEFPALFRRVLNVGFQNGGFSFRIQPNEEPIDAFSRFLEVFSPNSLVLLIDEYDAPLNTHLHEPDIFEGVRSQLSQFYSLIKGMDSLFHFVFLTGIAKFNKASIFSAFNNLTDISLDPQYGTLLGYTEDEILNSFGEYVEQAADVNHLTVPQMMDAMREKYDGFCFDQMASTHVYAPWSVLSFLNAPHNGLQNFWYGSAGNSSMVRNYFTKHQMIQNVDDFGEEISVLMDSLKESNDSEALSVPVFLYQAGYLTIKRADEDFAYLNFPNGEVSSAMNTLMATQMQKSKAIVDIRYSKWRFALESANLDGFVQVLNDVFLQIDYMDYPLQNESDVRAAVQIYLLGGRQLVEIERHNAKGRSDMEFLAKDVYWILEFKYAKKGSNSKRLLQSAIKQIQERQYGRIPESAKHIVRAGIVFNATKKQFTSYQLYTEKTL